MMPHLLAPLAAAALLAVALSSCGVVQVRVSPRNPAETGTVRRIGLDPGPESASARQLDRLRSEKSLDDASRLAGLLATARQALPGALEGNADARALYDAAVRDTAALLARHDYALQPAPGNIRSLRVVRDGLDTLDPATADSLVPADQIAIRGLRDRCIQTGIGLPFVASFARRSPQLAGEPGVPKAGMAVPATAVLTFRDDVATLEWIRTLRRDTIRIDGSDRRLAADFSAPLATMVANSGNRRIDLRAMFFPATHLQEAGLIQFQPYDPRKIPVVFVHGLMSRPEAWVDAINTLLADPEIRARYQFWFYLYPTGLPVWGSAAGLRRELDRYDAALRPVARAAGHTATLDSKVLVGHSMGGLISGLMVREGGDALWSKFSDTPVENLAISEKSRATLRELIFFSPRRDISRVIFVATPHRGSPFALRPIAGFAASLIRLPVTATFEDRGIILEAVRSDLRNALSAPANSIRFLRSDSPLLLSILELPMAPDVEYHTILGDRGRNDSPESSDGIVPYRSAHLPSAVTEAIVPSNHGANEHPDGIREIQRILRENAR